MDPDAINPGREHERVNRFDHLNLICPDWPYLAFLESLPSVLQNDNKEKFPFLKEFLSGEISKYIEKLSLSDYDDWKEFLTKDMYKYDYHDYVDNWLHFDVSIVSREIIESISYLGKVFNIVKYKYTHKICKKEWEYYSIETPSGYDTEQIIGYKF